MSPRQPTSYRPPKDRRELTLAVLSVVGILIFTIAMVVLLGAAGRGHADGASRVAADDGPGLGDHASRRDDSGRHGPWCDGSWCDIRDDRELGSRGVTTRAEFEAARGFALDDFQQLALDALDAGRSVLVAAPTGSGKTIVAEYAVDRARARRQGLLHDAAQGPVEPEVRRLRAHARSRQGRLADRRQLDQR